MYLTKSEYIAIYGNIDEATFNRCLFSAEKAVEDATLTADNVNKMVKAYPTDTRAVQCIKRCIADAVNLLVTIDSAKATMNDGRLVTSRSAGNESISYGSSEIDKAVIDATAQDDILRKRINSTLRGVMDKNGVKMLYKGIYPFKV